jgi:hypothetical protein
MYIIPTKNKKEFFNGRLLCQLLRSEFPELSIYWEDGFFNDDSNSYHITIRDNDKIAITLSSLLVLKK